MTLLSAQQAAAYYDPDKSNAAYADARRLSRRSRGFHPPRDRGAGAARLRRTSRSTRRSTRRSSTRRSARATGSAATIPIGMLDTCIELDNAIIDGHPGVTFGIHICRGNHKSMFYASGGYDRIAGQIFSRARFHRFLLEYDDERSGSSSRCDTCRTIASWCSGSSARSAPQLEAGAELTGAIAEASRYVPLERLAISPQCGFASTHEGNAISPDDAARRSWSSSPRRRQSGTLARARAVAPAGCIKGQHDEARMTIGCDVGWELGLTTSCAPHRRAPAVLIAAMASSSAAAQPPRLRRRPRRARRWRRCQSAGSLADEVEKTEWIAAGPVPPDPPFPSARRARCPPTAASRHDRSAAGRRRDRRYGIGFAIALPDDWNGRLLMQGGGGFNGRVGTPSVPWRRATRRRSPAASPW